MDQASPLLVLTEKADPAAIARIAECARAARLGSAVPCDGPAADRWLSNHVPAAIALDLRASRVESVCTRLRADLRLAGVPIIGLAERLDDVVFPEIYSWGGDDVIALDDTDALRERLYGAAATVSPPTREAMGVAVVASPSPSSRAMVARVLTNAGYETRYAADGAAAIEAARDDRARVVVADGDLGDGTAFSAIVAMRAAGAHLPWVVRVPPRELRSAVVAGDALRRVGVVDAYGGADAALYVANELVRGAVVDLRASRRVLYATSVWFRLAGRARDSVGCSFNISAGGAYVRTLAPPEAGEIVWVEMQPPRSAHRVRLEGRVAWRRPFGHNETALAPPGFGFEIIDGSATDIARHRAGYEAFAREYHSPA